MFESSFSVSLGRIASDFSLPRCELELEVKGKMFTSSYSAADTSADPIPTYGEWLQLSVEVICNYLPSKFEILSAE